MKYDISSVSRPDFAIFSSRRLTSSPGFSGSSEATGVEAKVDMMNEEREAHVPLSIYASA